MAKDSLLMYINTVNNNVSNSSHQEIFDSREKNEKSFGEDNFFQNKKINNIVEMYNKNRPVLCTIITKNGQIIGTPYGKTKATIKIKRDLLDMKNNNEEKEDLEISFNDIVDIIILNF